jgi:hypothetical protein
VNRDREEIRVPSPFGGRLLDHLSRKGLRGAIRTDAAGDVVTLLGEPDMSRVIASIADFKMEPEGAATSA